MDSVDKQLSKETITNLIDAVNGCLQNGGTVSLEKVLKGSRDTKAIRSKLMGIYDAYKEPRFSHTSYRSFFGHSRSEQRAIDRERQAVATANNRSHLELDLSTYDDISNEKEKIIEVEKTWYGLCPFKKNWTILLQNKHDTVFSYYTKNIKYYGSTNLIASPDTVTSLIKDAEAKGLSKKQVAELFMGYCAAHAKELNAATASKFADKDYRGVFQCVVNRIDDLEERDKIDEALKKIVRLPGQNINVVCGDLENLLLQNINIHQPYASEHEKSAIAGGYILNNIKYFINNETLQEYNRWLKKALGSIKVDKERAIERIEEIEQSRDRYKLTVEKRLPKEISVLDLASTEAVSASVNVMQKSKQKDNFRGRDPQRRQNSRGRSPGGPRLPRSLATSGSRSRTPRSRSASVHSLGNDRRPGQPSADRRSRSDSRRSQDRRGRSFTPRGNSQGRRNDRSQRSSSYDRRDRRNDRNRTDRRSASNDQKKSGSCFKCGDSRHWAQECFRYSTMTKTPCHLCVKAGRGNLMHDAFSCRFDKRNNYRSPSATTRTNRINDLRSRQDRRPNRDSSRTPLN